MTFIQWEFLAFFGITLALYWGFPHRRFQNLLLAVGSALFYGWVHPWFLILLYGSAFLDFNMGRFMREQPERKKLWLTLSMCGNLGMLGYFKYMDFFIANVAAVMEALGFANSPHTLGIFLPVGISFYTFQTMSYTIDIYKGEFEPRKDPLDYLVFVSFFPQLVAGPVERASRLLPQMEVDRRFDADKFVSGTSLALYGAAKKVLVADTIAPYVDKIFLVDEPSGAMIWAATLGFSIQILADFSGYTDIARGTARMLGFELMENFKHPYLATTPSDFWRRWHVSFSTWIRDYLYIPLGGNRGGYWGTVRSTFGAMTLSGLWHGASWNFILWGAYHAALITGYRHVQERFPFAFTREPTAWRWLTVPVMFLFTNLGWMIFRETDITRLFHYWTLWPLSGTQAQWIAASTMLLVCLWASVPLLVALGFELWLWPRLRGHKLALPVQTTLWGVAAVVLFLFVRTSNNDFIYFQF